MTILTFLWRFTIGGAWKWLAAGAGLVGVYLKVRSGDKDTRQAGQHRGPHFGQPRGLANPEG